MKLTPTAVHYVMRLIVAGFAVALPVIAQAAASAPSTAERVRAGTSADFPTFARQLQRQAADSRRFRQPGPFAIEMHPGYALPVGSGSGSTEERAAVPPTAGAPAEIADTKPATDAVSADLFLSRHADKAPLVIFMHGYGGAAENHHDQAKHLASWGMHGMTLRLPNDSEWGANGKTLGHIVRLMSNPTGVLRGRIDPGRIVLVGYSFGAISTAVALAPGTQAAGAVLLDPATPLPDIGEWLSPVRKPVMIVGADERIARAANRSYFFKTLGGPVAEVSVAGASHEDGQSLSDDDLATNESQLMFTSVLTAAAFSLAVTGRLEYAWRSLAGSVRAGKLFDARRK